MNSNRWKSQDQAHVWHPYTRSGAPDFPIIVRGEGIHLIDEHGTRYVDAIASWWCAALGHGRREIIEAISRQAAVLQHSILGNLSHPSAIQLASELASLMPSRDRHVLFASDGASAVEQAIKIAIQYRHNIGEPGRNKIACLAGAYHGDTLGAMSVGYLEHFHAPFRSWLANVVQLPFPDSPDSIRAGQSLLDSAARELTAVIVEPLCLGAVGMKMYPADWLRWLGGWCARNGVLLIVDEIATGLGRTGRMFAFEHAGVDPDLVCVGKALAAGYLPISATIARDAIYGSFEGHHVLQHGHTFCGNPIAAAAALACLEIYRTEGIVERAARLGELLRAQFEPLRSHRAVKDVRCLGMIGAVELQPADGRARRVREILQQAGVLLRPLGDVIYVMPPLTIAEDELSQLVDMLVVAIQSATK